MKYVSITFDDGRKDNYTEAFPIMNKNKLTGTIFCTTGFIDKTWEKPTDWLSAGEPIKIEQLLELRKNGWEIALHGDKHTTAIEDLTIAIEKMKSWGLFETKMGFSIPNSAVPREELDDVIHSMLGSEIQYIRSGRRINTKKISARLLFIAYSICKFRWAYNLFNVKNVNRIDSVNDEMIYSVVVRNKDSVNMIEHFIETAPENTWIVLMFHSVIDKDNPLYNSDPWNWSSEKFTTLCKFLSEIQSREIVRVMNMSEVMEEIIHYV